MQRPLRGSFLRIIAPSTGGSIGAIGAAARITIKRISTAVMQPQTLPKRQRVPEIGTLARQGAIIIALVLTAAAEVAGAAAVEEVEEAGAAEGVGAEVVAAAAAGAGSGVAAVHFLASTSARRLRRLLVVTEASTRHLHHL